MSEVRFCGLVPTYDNPRTVREVVTALREHVGRVVVVDDGSANEGREVVDALARESVAEVVRHTVNRGKGAAVKSGLRWASERGFSHVVQIDADAQHDVADVPKFVAVARERPEALVTGQPVFDETVPAARLHARKISKFWVDVEVGRGVIADPLCGFRVYPVEATLALKIHGDAMDFDPEVAVRLAWSGVPVINLPTRVRYISSEEGGVSHFRLGRDNALISAMHSRLCIEAMIRWARRR